MNEEHIMMVGLRVKTDLLASKKKRFAVFDTTLHEAQKTCYLSGWCHHIKADQRKKIINILYFNIDFKLLFKT